MPQGEAVGSTNIADGLQYDVVACNESEGVGCFLQGELEGTSATSERVFGRAHKQRNKAVCAGACWTAGIYGHNRWRDAAAAAASTCEEGMFGKRLGFPRWFWMVLEPDLDGLQEFKRDRTGQDRRETLAHL